jgi:hypothetical protein
MQVACNVIHQTIRSQDLKGRTYTMNLTHYVECGTGRIIRTRSHQITPERIVMQRVKRDPVQRVKREAGQSSQSSQPSPRGFVRRALGQFFDVLGL